MNYTLELNVPGVSSNVVFNTVFLNSFKVNIVERYSAKVSRNPKLCEVLFKVRTLDDKIMEKKDGNLNTYIRGEAFAAYQNLKDVLSSYNYKNRLINRAEAEQDLVHFILSLVISNYELN